MPWSSSFLPSPTRPISVSEQSIPSLITPPMSRGVSVIPTAGSVVPSGAKHTRPPGAGTLVAPQTTRCSTPPPRSTVTSWSFSRLGWGSILLTSATTIAAVPAPYSSRPSTAMPALEKRSPSSCGETSRPGRRALSQR